MRHVVVGSIVAPWLVAAAGAQQEAWRVDGVARSESLGHSFAIVDDRNGDGVSDLLIAVPGYDGDDAVGRVLLVSGTDLSLLLQIDGPTTAIFGSAIGNVADVGDVDGDGVGDFYVGWPVADLARLCSGATGATLLEVAATVPTSSFGSGGVGLGDVDGDGVPDFAVGAPFLNVGSGKKGRVRVTSGATGATIRSYDGHHAEAFLGDRDSLANAGDLDGDSIADLALLDVEKTGTLTYSVVRVVSGATGVEFLTVKFDQVGYRGVYLRSIANLGDLDGDGLPDLAVGGMPNNGSVSVGRVFLLSGATGATIRYVNVGDQPGWVVVGATDDQDGDLVPDFVVGTTDFNPPGVRIATVTLWSGATGLALASSSGAVNTAYGRAFAAGIDADGDGARDVTIGEEGFLQGNLQVGAATTTSWLAGPPIAQITGAAVDRLFAGDVAQIDDFDGDGTNDFVSAHPRTMALNSDALRVHSGRDGSLLVEHLIPVRPDGELVAVPDLDGDGHDDVAFGEDVTSQNSAVEVRSTATGQLLWRFTGATGSGFGRALDVGVQPGGVVQLAIGAPYSWLSTPGGGEVQVIDLATGSLVFQRGGNPPQEWLGYDVAFLGDVDGDGIGDWAMGAPRNSGAAPLIGRVLIMSGTGVRLKAIIGKLALEQFGTAVTGVGDVDGDGLGDFAASAPYGGSFDPGEVRIWGSNGWTLFQTVQGEHSFDDFGTLLERLPDVNGDGVDEWAAFGRGTLQSLMRVDLRSGLTGGLLARLLTVSDRPRFATPQPWHVGSANGDGHPDVLVVDIEGANDRSQAWLVALDDLLLQLIPDEAAAGVTVTSTTSGGPQGAPVALEFVAFAGAPVGEIVDLATFDSFGMRTLSDTVPPGVAGLTADFRAWGIGFNGRLITSPMQTLTLK